MLINLRCLDAVLGHFNPCSFTGLYITFPNNSASLLQSKIIMGKSLIPRTTKGSCLERGHKYFWALRDLTLHESLHVRYIYCVAEEKFWFQKIHSSLTVFIAFPAGNRDKANALHCIQHQQPSLLLAKDRIYALCVIAWFCQKPVTVVASPPSITSPNLHVYNSAGIFKLFYLYYSYNACIILGNIVLCDGFWLTIFIHALQLF